jgi:predicted heme/steroid binding protein
MEIPDRKITQAELRRSSGDRGSPKWVAYRGVVYDVSDCPRWRGDLHEGLHFPGQDLTAEVAESPHKELVFTRPCLRVVGTLEG